MERLKSNRSLRKKCFRVHGWKIEKGKEQGLRGNWEAEEYLRICGRGIRAIGGHQSHQSRGGRRDLKMDGRVGENQNESREVFAVSNKQNLMKVEMKNDKCFQISKKYLNPLPSQDRLNKTSSYKYICSSTYSKKQQFSRQDFMDLNLFHQNTKKYSQTKLTKKIQKPEVNTKKQPQKIEPELKNDKNEKNQNENKNQSTNKIEVKISTLPVEKKKENAKRRTLTGMKNIQRRNTCKLFLSGFRGKESNSKAIMRNLIVHIEASRYQQIGEECVYPDGTKQKIYKILKTLKDQNCQKENEDEDNYLKANQKFFKGIEEKNNETRQFIDEIKQSELPQKMEKGIRKYKSSRFSQLLQKQSLQKIQKFIQQNSIDNQSQSSQKSEQKIEIISKTKLKKQKRKHQSMRKFSQENCQRISINSRLSKSTKQSKKFVILDRLLSQMEANKNMNITFEGINNGNCSIVYLNDRVLYSLSRTKLKKKSIRSSVSNPSSPFKPPINYRWQKWQVKCKKQPKQQLTQLSISKKIIEKQQQQQNEFNKIMEKKYQELHRLLNETSQIRRMKNNQNLIMKMREQNMKDIDGVFEEYQKQMLLV